MLNVSKARLPGTPRRIPAIMRNKKVEISNAPFPDYPGNARSFVHMDTRLLPYWHNLFDVCPGLLRIDPPEGLDLFREFLKWAYRHHTPMDWTYHLNLCRWLLNSRFQSLVLAEHIEQLMVAAAANWVNTDKTSAQGVVLAWQGSDELIFDWKSYPEPRLRHAMEAEELPNTPWDFSWCPLTGKKGNNFARWLPVMG